MGGYKKEDWERVSTRLERAQELIASAKEAARQRKRVDRQESMDQAVFQLWSFAEYAVNVLLELTGSDYETHHQHPKRVRELMAQGLLAGDYSTVLEQLQSFRLRSAYGGFSSRPSVHYSTANLDRCLVQMLELRTEVNAALDAQGKR